jgi:hypothetical protein
MTAASVSVSVLSAAWARLDEALHARRPVWVSYHRRRRLLCPHALGWRAGRPMVLGYQTGGETSTGEPHSDPTKRWRLLYIDEIDEVAAADPASNWDSADNYNPTRPSPAIVEICSAVNYMPPPKRP